MEGLVLFVADGISLIVVCEQSFSLYPSETALREVSYANGQIGGDHVGGQGSVAECLPATRAARV